MWEFIKSSSNKNNWFQHSNNEICFIGRSNVGKSSLVNSLTNIKNLARVSNMPGRTQLINFFKNGNKVIVDLPGYGYAQINKNIKQKIDNMVKEYFLNRVQLKKIFVLIDARICPTNDDIEIINFLKENNLPIMIIVTKSDKANQSQIFLTIKNIKNFGIDFIIISSRKGTNIGNLKKIINAQF